MYKILDFSMLLYLGKLIYIQKSRNKQIFADPCKIHSGKSKTVGIILQGLVQKQFEIESPFFAAMLFGLSTSKKYFMFNFKKIKF